MKILANTVAYEKQSVRVVTDDMIVLLNERIEQRVDESTNVSKDVYVYDTVYVDDYKRFSDPVGAAKDIFEKEYRKNNPLTLDEAKVEKIKKLHEKYQREYDEYLSQYPKREVESFATKQSEAIAYRLDNTAPTSTIDAMCFGDETKRVELINAILEKIDYLASQEGLMLSKRDMIKACTTIEDVESVEI